MGHDTLLEARDLSHVRFTTNANIEFVNTKNVGIPTAAMTNTGIITAIAVCCGGVVIVAIVRAVKKKKK